MIFLLLALVYLWFGLYVAGLLVDKPEEHTIAFHLAMWFWPIALVGYILRNL